MKNYLPRITDKLLRERLNAKGAVLIEGPKWCGKTTTAKQIAKSYISMDKPDMTRQYQQMAEISPNVLLDGETPRLIDEWQISPDLWNAVRYEVDNRDNFGQFILTNQLVLSQAMLRRLMDLKNIWYLLYVWRFLTLSSDSMLGNLQ